MKNPYSYYKNLSVPKKASLWYLVSSVLQKGISFLVVPFYVRYLTSSEYGHVMMFYSWQAVLLILVTLNLYCGVYTKAMVDYADDRDKYTSSMLGLTTALTLLWFIIYLFCSDRWNDLFEIDDFTSYLLFIYFFTSPSFTFWSVRQRVENKYHEMVYLTVAKSVITPVLCLFLLYNTELRANALIWGLLIIDSLFGIYFYVSQLIKGKCFYDYDYWIHALKFNIPLIPHYLSLIVLAQVDRILIGNICGKDKAGIYSLAAQISLIMSVVVASINGAFVPWLYEQYRTANFHGVRKTSNELCVIVGAMTLMLMLVVPEIVAILGTEEYVTAIWIVPPILLGIYFSFCYGLFSNVEFYYSRTKNVAFATTVGAGLSLVLNFILLPRLGFISAGYTSLICYLVFMLLHYRFMLKICVEELDRQNFYDIKFIWLSCLALFVVMCVCLLSFNLSFVYRYVVLLVIVLLFIKNKNRIIYQFKLK